MFLEKSFRQVTFVNKYENINIYITDKETRYRYVPSKAERHCRLVKLHVGLKNCDIGIVMRNTVCQKFC